MAKRKRNGGKKRRRSAAQKAATRALVARNKRSSSPRRSTSRSAPRRGGGGRLRSMVVGGLTAIVRSKTIEGAVVGAAGSAPDVLVFAGELQRVRIEGKSFKDAAIDFARYELFQYTGIWYDRTEVGNSISAFLSSVAQTGSWSWRPLDRLNYDIPGVGRSPLKVGMIDNYGMKFLPRILLKFAKKIPLVGKVARMLLNAPNPLRRLG